MKRIFLISAILLSAFILLPAAGPNTADTRMLTQPAISRELICFSYANDLWVAGLDGKNIRRLTVSPGYETNPCFSPDGRLIAFSGQYDGNTDVYVVPAEGGVPRRLTWHPGPDLVRGFTPDGRAVLFSSPRQVFTNRYTQLFTVPVEGGFPELVPVPNAFTAAYSPDGRRLAYNPIAPRFAQWKHYRGGTVSVIWLYGFADRAVEKIPQPEGRSNDTDPMWIGDKVYFRSDRNGEFNIYSYDTHTRQIAQLTRFEDFPVQSASAAAGKIILEQAGYLHLLDLASSKGQRLKLGLAADLIGLRPRYAKGDRFIRNADLSPSGARAVFGFRGEIVTVPAEKGDPRNLTNSPAVHERLPVWSPDGRQVAYFSDESGEYALHLRSQDGKGVVKKFKLPGTGFYEAAEWSPDSQKIAFRDNSLALYWLDVTSGAVKKIASEKIYGPTGLISLSPSWSPDSRWIAYTLNTTTYFQTVYLYSLEKDQSLAVTDGLSEVSEPVFDTGGKYLYFFASTDAGPAKQWFDLSNRDMRETNTVYLAVLGKDMPSPLAKESDEEKPAAPKEAPQPAGKNKAASGKAEAEKPAKPTVTVDFDGLNYRILAIGLPSGSYSNLLAGKENEFYYLDRDPSGDGKLHKYDLGKRKDEVIGEKISRFVLSADKAKLLYLSGGKFAIAGLAGKIEPGKGLLNIEAIEVAIDPAREWPQILREVWRINRDYFYAPNMHGADWKAMWDKYAAFLPDLSCREDLNRLIQWLCSELVVGHSYSGGGDFGDLAKAVPGGLLGADYAVENGRYRFKKIFGGLNWNPELKSPLTEPGINVREGEYLLAVNGVDLEPPVSVYSPFENSSGKIVEITVGPNPDGSGARTVEVVPLASETALRNRDWVESNIRKVQAATNGRVAYVYVPDTSVLGHAYFKRYFFPQADKEAIIVDERFNGGGSLADYYIDILRRPFIAWWATRYGQDIKSPGASIQGPKVMIIDETAGSGGDLLPWMFRKFKLGTLVGKRTWGGLVGILGFPVLMDGGSVTAPNLAIWTETGWVVENEGVPPDAEVEQWPAEVLQGHDPQLEKAIEIIMKQLPAAPPARPQRPAYPVKVEK
ncbi:MAG TPA: PDZ domain-containing protein [Acidobacteriota bacterium]